MVGQTIAHYRITGELGRGGMGVVYRAEDQKLGRSVALKFLAETLGADPALRERFLREARAAASLNHPNVCTIYEINDSGTVPFIAMELLEGETLQQRLEAGPIGERVLLETAVQVADALAAAHAKGIVHRDIKPGNVFLTGDGRAKVVDFGLAKPTPRGGAEADSRAETALRGTTSMTHAGTTLGTVAYMSPEQARGEDVDARSDVFSFGLVLYEMATGRRAFDGATTALIFDGILNRTPEAPSSVNPAVSADLEDVIAHAIEKAPAARYQRAAEVGADLRRLLHTSDPAVASAVAPAVSPGAASRAWGQTPARGTRSTARRGRQRRIGAALALGLAAVALGTAVVIWRSGPVDALADGDPVLVLDFENRAGDPDFDGTLRQALVIKLEESPFVTVVSPQRVREVLALMARDPGEPVTRTTGLEVCRRMGVKALLAGDIATLGTTYVLTLTAESCATGDAIATEQAEARRKEDVLAALGRASSAIRRRLGESLASIEKLDRPMFEATTSSLQALQSFGLGDERRAAGVEAEAIAFYRRAVELDPQFAMAHGRLGTVYANLGEPDLARTHYQRAYELRDRASERERFYIEAHYFNRVASDPDRARQVYELWRQTYPHDYVPVHNLGTIHSADGRYEDALAAFLEAARLEPRNRLARDVAAQMLVLLDRDDEARQLAERTLVELGPAPMTHQLLYQLDYLRGDSAAMEKHAAALAGTPYELDRMGMDYQFAILEGRFAEGRRLLDVLAAEAGRRGFPQRALGLETGHAAAEALVGFTEHARRSARALLARQIPDDFKLNLAFALLVTGDEAGARRLAAPAWARLDRQPAQLGLLRPLFDAWGAMRRGEPARAIQALEAGRPWEGRGQNSIAVWYLRGLAQLELGEAAAAESSFRAIISRRGLAKFDSAYALAHLGVARARARTGDPAGARQAYDEFFRMWSRADADVPVLLEARAEYAKLQPGD